LLLHLLFDLLMAKGAAAVVFLPQQVQQQQVSVQSPTVP
jgi:hypothetical protein